MDFVNGHIHTHSPIPPLLLLKSDTKNILHINIKFIKVSLVLAELACIARDGTFYFFIFKSAQLNPQKETLKSETELPSLSKGMETYLNIPYMAALMTDLWPSLHGVHTSNIWLLTKNVWALQSWGDGGC